MVFGLVLGLVLCKDKVQRFGAVLGAWYGAKQR